MSEMKLIMENFRMFSEQNTCTGGTCVIKAPPDTVASLTATIKDIEGDIVQLKARKADATYIAKLEELLADKKAKLKKLKSKQVNEAGETGPDPLGLRYFGNIHKIDGFNFFEGESMENNQKIYRYRFDNLKSARAAANATSLAANKSTENKKMLASKKISLVSAEVLPSKKAGLGIAINQPTELKVTWNVGKAVKDEAPVPMNVAPGLPAKRIKKK